MYRYLLHFTHNDADAVGCVLVANSIDRKSIIPDKRISDHVMSMTYFCNAGGGVDEIIKDVLEDNVFANSNATILITDNSITDETAKYLEEYRSSHIGIELLLVDHHISNDLNRKYDWVHVDPSHSACYNLLQILDERYSLKENLKYYDDLFDVVNDISRYDTWQWKTDPKFYNEDKYAIICNLFGNQLSVDLLTQLIEKGCYYKELDEFLNKIIKRYKENRDNAIKSLIDNSDDKLRIVNRGGRTLGIIMLGDKYVNDLMEAVYTNFPFIDIVVGIDPVHQKLSFRTNKDNIDVSDFARKQGGGGHRTAGGAVIKDPKVFLDWLKLFYIRDDENGK